jgi:hypothetical protein
MVALGNFLFYLDIIVAPDDVPVANLPVYDISRFGDRVSCFYTGDAELVADFQRHRFVDLKFKTLDERSYSIFKIAKLEIIHSIGDEVVMIWSYCRTDSSIYPPRELRPINQEPKGLSITLGSWKHEGF